jgi:hypothetical protein
MLTGGNIVIATGEKYDGEHYEMNAEAVVLHGKRQEIADRAAATFRLIDTKVDNFFALLDGAKGCAVCGRALREEMSKLVGVGPCCFLGVRYTALQGSSRTSSGAATETTWDLQSPTSTQRRVYPPETE